MADGQRELGAVPSHLGLTRVAAETFLATAAVFALSLRLDTGLLWLFVPLALIVLPGRSLSAHGFDLRLRPPSLGAHLGLGAALLAGYGAMHAGFAVLWQHRSFAPHLPAGLLLGLVPEFLGVAFPEEAFFRGYLQTRWNLALGRRWRAFGARIGPGLFVQAVAFAACHALAGDWTRARVFFFALLAGWLRERCDSILAPAVYHASANAWYRLLEASFR
jgi:membrane protease YdiL (CAAX protease family)